MLRNSSRLFINDMRITNCIQKRRLTMVNMTHNADNRRTFFHCCFILAFLFQQFCNHIYLFLHLTDAVELQCNLFSCSIINFIVYRHDISLKK